MKLEMTVNGRAVAPDVEPHHTLLDVLRDKLDLLGVREGCSLGDCGACTVLMDGTAVVACLVLAPDAAGRVVTTIEGLERDGKLDPMQEAFIAKGAIQCGFCTPGMIMAAKAVETLEGNLCRCTGYAKILEAMRSVKR